MSDWADRLDHDGWAACLLDGRQNLVWVSREMRQFLDEQDEERLGYGRHFAEALLSDTWGHTIAEESQRALVRDLLPYFADDSSPIDQTIRGAVNVKPPVERRAQPPLLAGDFRYSDDGEPSYLVRYLGVLLREESGTPIGTLIVTDLSAPATLIALLAQGDRAMHERMAELLEPGRHPAAVLFADLPGSGELSRRLPTSVYFELIRTLTAKFDALVGTNQGVVGKHVGDGMTAFFLASQTGGEGSACCAALRTVDELQRVAPAIFTKCLDSTDIDIDGPCRFDVALHWGPNLYVGQLVPESRLDVTALGDEINECARIQETAHGGTTLASKQFVELLHRGCLERCDLDPSALSYQQLAKFDGASDKAIRDAGTVPVTVLPIW